MVRDMGFPKVLGLEVIPYSVSIRDFLNLRPINYDPWSSIISMDLGYMDSHTVSNKFTIDIDILSFTCPSACKIGRTQRTNTLYDLSGESYYGQISIGLDYNILSYLFLGELKILQQLKYTSTGHLCQLRSERCYKSALGFLEPC